jgi:hypothetical protein
MEAILPQPCFSGIFLPSRNAATQSLLLEGVSTKIGPVQDVTSGVFD